MTGSFLDELRAAEKAVRKHAVKELPVPPSGALVVRFRPPAREKLTDPIAAFRVRGSLDEDEELQLFVDCCDEILRRGEDGELVPADPEGGPLRFDAGDERWGNDVKVARDCVRKLYNLELQPAALGGQSAVLMDWLQGVDAAVDSAISGESDGSVPS